MFPAYRIVDSANRRVYKGRVYEGEVNPPVHPPVQTGSIYNTSVTEVTHSKEEESLASNPPTFHYSNNLNNSHASQDNLSASTKSGSHDSQQSLAISKSSDSRNNDDLPERIKKYFIKLLEWDDSLQESKIGNKIAKDTLEQASMCSYDLKVYLTHYKKNVHTIIGDPEITYRKLTHVIIHLLKKYYTEQCKNSFESSKDNTGNFLPQIHANLEESFNVLKEFIDESKKQRKTLQEAKEVIAPNSEVLTFSTFSTLCKSVTLFLQKKCEENNLAVSHAQPYLTDFEGDVVFAHLEKSVKFHAEKQFYEQKIKELISKINSLSSTEAEKQDAATKLNKATNSLKKIKEDINKYAPENTLTTVKKVTDPAVTDELYLAKKISDYTGKRKMASALAVLNKDRDTSEYQQELACLEKKYSRTPDSFFIDQDPQELKEGSIVSLDENKKPTYTQRSYTDFLQASANSIFSECGPLAFLRYPERSEKNRQAINLVRQEVGKKYGYSAMHRFDTNFRYSYRLGYALKTLELKKFLDNEKHLLTQLGNQQPCISIDFDFIQMKNGGNYNEILLEKVTQLAQEEFEKKYDFSTQQDNASTVQSSAVVSWNAGATVSDSESDTNSLASQSKQEIVDQDKIILYQDFLEKFLQRPLDLVEKKPADSMHEVGALSFFASRRDALYTTFFSLDKSSEEKKAVKFVQKMMLDQSQTKWSGVDKAVKTNFEDFIKQKILKEGKLSFEKLILMEQEVSKQKTKENTFWNQLRPYFEDATAAAYGAAAVQQVATTNDPLTAILTGTFLTTTGLAMSPLQRLVAAGVMFYSASKENRQQASWVNGAWKTFLPILEFA